jgi:beta-carotene ketolase (CrtW type)
MAAWSTLLVFTLSRPINALPFWSVPLLMAGMTFLYTGLFITAHDAMHGTVFPRNRKVNNAIGAAALFAFAMFWWPSTLKNHHAHHAYPGTVKDPDFYDAHPQNFFRWYFRFFVTYFRIPQLIGLAVAFNLLVHLAGVHELNTILFWAVPPVLSSLQLFYFGTWLPHRRGRGGFRDNHNARSNAYPVLLSFLSCYHFGYHWEHHASPQTPWWALPKKRRELSS